MDPKYFQPLSKKILESLRSNILQGKWKTGNAIPTELQLCEQYSASRSTIRKALKILTDEGYLARKAGKGTWVTDKPDREESFRYKYLSDYPFPEQIKIDFLQIDNLAHNSSDNLFNGFPSDEMFVRIKALRSLKETPLAYTEIYLTETHAEKVLESFKKGSDIYVYKVLERVTGARIKEIHEVFSAILAVGELANRLKVMDGSPLIAINRQFLDENNNQVQATRVYLRPDVNLIKIVREVAV
ncbi:GntR family transcriptional regulator [bacterium]|nr:GntR family transcriptional regulator [bacterium]